MRCPVRGYSGVLINDRPARRDQGTDLGVERERAVEPNEVEPGSWHQGGQTLHEFERGQDDMSRSIFIGAFQLQHDITGAVECEPFVGDSGAGDVAAQLFLATRSRFLELSLTQRDRKWDHPFRRVYLPA